jgi:hypothetical protein
MTVRTVIVLIVEGFILRIVLNYRREMALHVNMEILGPGKDAMEIDTLMMNHRAVLVTPAAVATVKVRRVIVVPGITRERKGTLIFMTTVIARALPRVRSRQAAARNMSNAVTARSPRTLEVSLATLPGPVDQRLTVRVR